MIEVFNAGKFFSRGRGSHPVRIIDSDELIFVLQGELAISEEDRFYLLKPNDYLLLHRGRKHGGWMPYPKNLRYIWLHFRADESFWQQQPDSGHLLRGDRIVGYLQDFLLEQSLSDADPVNLQLLFQLIFRELRRSIRKGENAETTPWAAAAERYLRLHCTEPIHIGSITEQVYQKEMEVPIEDMKRYLDGILHLYDEGRTKVSIPELFGIVDQAKQKLIEKGT